VLRNLARGSNKGGDAKQDVALNQPKALPLIDGDGYLYVPDVTGNSSSTPDASTLDITGSLTIEVDFNLANYATGSSQQICWKWETNQQSYILNLQGSGRLRLFLSSSGSNQSFAESDVLPFANNTRGQIRITYNRTNGDVLFYTSTDKKQTWTQLGTTQTIGPFDIFNSTSSLFIANRSNGSNPCHGAIHSVQIYDSVTPSSSSLRFNCDFTATNVRHGDTKFKCATGQVVTVNQSGNDPATVIKKPVLRFDGTNDGLQGLFNQTITEGAYMFAAFSVLGDGGEQYTRVFQTLNAGNNTPILFSSRNQSENNIYWYSSNNTWQKAHDGMYDDERGDILHELSFTDGLQKSRVNNADAYSATLSESNTEMFSYGIANNHSSGSLSAAIDLEYLALFPASITDAQADSVRNYINNRNNVFDLKDGFGYYFFDPQIFPIVDPADFVSYWNGNIVGSDLTLNASVSQSVVNHRPTRDGYKVTFNDNADHLVVASPLSGGQAGWQIVGTSLGTFAYRVNNTAVTELNLLGNAGTTRRVGESFGMLLLPESATGADIEAARKLLIDRGAADSVVSGSYGSVWNNRTDIVEFRHSSFQNALNLIKAFKGQTALTSFSAIHAEICTNFSQTWQDCSSLQQFPAGAKLGTEATGTVIFDNAWNSSGITSFSTPLPTATSVSVAWGYCSALAEFNLDSLPLVLNVSQAWRNTGLTSFNTNLPSTNTVTFAWYQATSLSSFGAVDIKSCTDFNSAWRDCSALTSFPSGAKLGTSASNVNFTAAWRNTGLTSFPNDIDLSKGNNFHATWLGDPITSFSTPLPAALDISYAWYQCSSLSSFSTPVIKSETLGFAWLGCSALTDFAEGLFDNWNPSIISTGIFNGTWDGCTSLTAISVENILVSIDASNQHGTDDGTSTGNPLQDSGIDIDYDGTALSAATNTAVDSLKAKGWSIIVNNVTL
jgi:hypothetical protein